jgi:hypothetical protein
LEVSQQPGFYDYLRTGIQLNFMIAIDFTASNRDPGDPRSLHYLAPNKAGNNPYQKCIRAVGEILCPYDPTQRFRVFGFGAMVGSETKHCFPLTFVAEAPCVQGLEGILAAYDHALPQIGLSGPTLFAEVIRHASRVAEVGFARRRAYMVLLIITDGVINDMQDTVDAIVEAGKLPLSIIIVGVGNANFDAMKVLDGDDARLTSRRGVLACRGLVQFVPFSKFKGQHYSALATEVLDQIPKQLCEWAQQNSIPSVGA